MKITKKLKIEIPDPRPAPKNHKYVDRGWGWKSDEEREYTIYGCHGWGYSKKLKAMGHPETYYLEIVRTHREDGTPVEVEAFPEMPEYVEKVEYFGADMSEEEMGDADSFIVFYPDKWSLKNVTNGNRNRHPSEGYGHYARVWYKKDKPKKKTLEETLGLLPDWLAERAVSQIDRYSVSAHKWEDGNDLESALHVFADWHSTDEEFPFWKQVFESIDGNEINYSKLPDNPDEPKQTQLSDLIGEDGQTTCYVVNDDGNVYTFIALIDGENWSDEQLGQGELTESYRWSHSPFTKFENANEFVFDEGGNDE